MINHEELIMLGLVNNLGRRTILKLVDYINCYNVVSADFKDYISIIQENFISKKIYYNYDEIRSKAQNIIEVCKKNKINIFSIFDDKYPKKLTYIDEKPILIYIQGNVEILNENKNIAIIGSRKPSRKGYEIGTILSEKLAKEGYNIISGLALGCDTAGHRGSLLGKGKTAAVIPSGHEYIYPRINKDLYYQILQNDGSIVSELVPYSKPMKHDFVDRNRLQAAFSDGLIVIESDLSSGTAYTVKYGIEYGKLIGCSGHENIYDLKKTNLNKKLVSEGNAIRISNFEDLIEFSRKSLEKGDRNV